MIHRALCLSLLQILVATAQISAVPTAPKTAAPGPPPPGAPAGAALAQGMAVPHPDLSAMQPTVREQVERLQQMVERVKSNPNASATEISEGFGVLGQGMQAFDLLDAAETCYTHALTLAPSDHRWWYYRGLLFHSKGAFEKAVSDLQKAAELKPDYLATQIRLGNALLELGVASAAERHFTRVRTAEPDNAAALYGLGRTALALGNLPQAISQLEETLKRQPGADIVHYQLAQAYRKAGDLAQAQFHLSQQGEREVSFADPLAFNLSLIVISTSFEVVRNLARQEQDFKERDFLGFVLNRLGDVPGITDQFRQVIEQLDQDSQASPLERGRMRFALGGLLARENQDEAAVAEFTHAIELAPSLIDARLKLGNGLARLGRFHDAISHYSAILARQPDHPEALGQRAAARSNLGDLAAARTDLERLLELEPQNRAAHFRLANLLERQGDADAAAKRLAETIPLGATPQEKADTLVTLAGLYRRHQDRESALDLYQKALAVDPENRPAMYELALFLGELRQYGEAAKIYAHLGELDPQHLEVRVAEATALILAGEHRKARERLEVELQRFPTSIDLKDILARHLAAAPDLGVRDGVRALTLAQELYASFPTAETIETLAMAYAQTGDFAQAVSWQKKLIAGSGVQPAEVRTRWERNLALYERQQPCCAQ